MTDTAKCEPPEALRGVDGFHWVQPPKSSEPRVRRWRWTWGLWQDGAAETTLAGYAYIEPVLTPAEVAALRAERDAAVAEVARLREALEEVLAADDAVNAEARRAEHPGATGWSSEPVARRHAAFTAARAALTQPSAAAGWRDIATAPDDVKDALFAWWDGEFSDWIVERLFTSDEEDGDTAKEWALKMNCTLWSPLPPLPAPPEVGE